MSFDKLKQLIDTMKETYGVPACQVLVSYKGRKVFSYGAGYRDEAQTQSVKESDLYILYSSTKVITNTAMLRLVEQGKLSLEDEVSKYLPEFAELQVKDGETVRPAKTKITIRHLSTMCGGLTYNLATPWIKEALAQGKKTTRELVAAIAEEPLLFDPGTDYNYSLCHDVIGAIIEIASGMSFGEFLQKEIFDPLGMKDTTFWPTAEQMSRITAQYSRTAEGKIVKVPETCVYTLADRYESGGAGLYSTAADYLIFAQTMANKGRTLDGSYQLLKPETIEMMRWDCVEGASLEGFRTKIHRPGYAYALGVRTMVEPEKYDFHTARGEFGWDGAASSYVSIHPDEEIAIFYGMQVLGYGQMYDEVHPKLRELVYEALGF